MQAASPLLSLSPSSPSFNSYPSSANLADIAARVVEEFRHDDGDSDIYDWEPESLCRLPEERKREINVNGEGGDGDDDDDEYDDDDDEEFEFAFACRKPDSPIPADEIFFNGQIKPIYPLFDTTLLLNDTPDHHQNPINGNNNGGGNNNNNNNSKSSKKTHRLPLRKLMISEDRETTTSSSSSEADDLDNLQPGTYCVWAPAKGSSAESSPGRCKKSNSTGSSKRWKFRDLLYRSHSDGKDTFMFLAPNKKNSDKLMEHEQKPDQKSDKVKGKMVVEEHYVKNKAIREDDKKRSYLPYRQDLVGFFNNVNGLSRNLQPF
ncbi:hypothetical protein ACOSP7_024205 [Xanthoceras sorbifolium]